MSTQVSYIPRPKAEIFLKDIGTALKKTETNPILFHVWGEVGVGKSSLLQEIRRTYESQGKNLEDTPKADPPPPPVKKRGWLSWLLDEPEVANAQASPAADPPSESSGKEERSVVVAQASFGLIEGIKDPIKLMKQLYDDLIKKLITQNPDQKDVFITQYQKYFDAINELQTQPIQEKGTVSDDQIQLVKNLLAGGVGLAVQVAAPGLGGPAQEGTKIAIDTIVDVARAGLTERDRIQNLLQQHRATQGKRELQELILDPITKLSQSFGITLKEWSSRYSILLLFDTYEGVAPGVNSWLVQLLQDSTVQSAAVRFVVSSRQSLFRVQGGDWERFKADHHNRVEELQLEPFDQDQTQAYLKPIGVTGLDDIEAIQ